MAVVTFALALFSCFILCFLFFSPFFAHPVAVNFRFHSLSRFSIHRYLFCVFDLCFALHDVLILHFQHSQKYSDTTHTERTCACVWVNERQRERERPCQMSWILLTRVMCICVCAFTTNSFLIRQFISATVSFHFGFCGWNKWTKLCFAVTIYCTERQSTLEIDKINNDKIHVCIWMNSNRFILTANAITMTYVATILSFRVYTYSLTRMHQNLLKAKCQNKKWERMNYLAFAIRIEIHHFSVECTSSTLDLSCIYVYFS